MNIYKGKKFLKLLKRSEDLNGITNDNYFLIPIKKIIGKLYLWIKVKRDTQYYSSRGIAQLEKYVNIQIETVSRKLEDNQYKSYIIDSDRSALQGADTLMIICHSKQDSSIIGTPQLVVYLIDKHKIKEFYKTDDYNYSNIGYSPEKDLWYYFELYDIKMELSGPCTIEEARKIFVNEIMGRINNEEV